MEGSDCNGLPIVSKKDILNVFITESLCKVFIHSDNMLVLSEIEIIP